MTMFVNFMSPEIIYKPTKWPELKYNWCIIVPSNPIQKQNYCNIQ